MSRTAVAGGLVPAMAVTSPRADGDTAVQETLQNAAFSSVDHLAVTDDILRKITGRDNPQALLAAFRIPAHDLSAVTDGLWVALDRVRDPGNLGTIIRTAAAMGARGIILVGDCCDAWQPETVRATMGTFARLKIVGTEEPTLRAYLQNWKGGITGTHLHERAVDYRAADYGQPHILMMGAEQTGLSDALTAACRQLVKIPMTDGVESLNLGVSTGIMLYEIARHGAFAVR